MARNSIPALRINSVFEKTGKDLIFLEDVPSPEDCYMTIHPRDAHVHKIRIDLFDGTPFDVKKKDWPSYFTQEQIDTFYKLSQEPIINADRDNREVNP